MRYRATTTSETATRESERLARRTVRALQKMTEGMPSGADTSLANVWDEVCVQVQGEHSVFWSAYVDTIEGLVAADVAKLGASMRQAMWLETDEGVDWEGTEGTPPWNENDITRWISAKVLNIASYWTNTRIERYLMREHD
jgi:hypothetical protein